MSTPATPPEPSFARTFLLPALWVFAVPCVGLLFSSYELVKWNGEIRASVRAHEQTQPSVSAEQLEEELAKIDVGAGAWGACGAFGFFDTPPNTGEGLCSDVLQFEWIRRLSQVLLGLAVLVGVALSAALWWASRAPKNLHQGFRFGWKTLRAFAVPHLIGQGIIIVFLSFWVTALLFNVYFIKLIFVAAALAVGAAFVALKALFAKSAFIPSEQGVRVLDADAPAFFANMGELATKIGTSPPTNVVLGIDDNFFVTEMPIEVVDRLPTPTNPRQKTTLVEGRTLYASLSLMRALSRAETNAVLAHELAHFSQGDTLQSQQLNPMLREFGAYMQTLAGSLTFGIGSCLIAFRAMFERIARQRSRAAEFSADAVAAKFVGAEHAGQALIKVGAYATYRAQTESTLLDSMTKEIELRLADRVVQGFSSFVADPGARVKLLDGLLDTGTPHPFDSHPPLKERLHNIGLTPPVSDSLAALADRPATSACDDIPAAAQIEQQLWTAYEERFQANHDFMIAVRLQPKTPEEIAHVERTFPAQEHPGKEGLVRLNWRALILADGTELPYGNMALVQTKELAFRGVALIIDTPDGAQYTVKLNDFADKGAAFMESFGRFYQRHNISVSAAAQQEHS